MLAITEHPDAASAILRIRLGSPSRERILAAARRLLRDGGYAGFGMEDLARACGLSRQTIYKQFADRDSVYRASRSQLVAAFADRLPRQVAPRGAAAEAIEDFVDAAFGALASAEHVELSRSAEVDAGACPWVAETYARRVSRPLAGAVLRYVGPLAAGRRADAAGRAADLVAMMRASVRAGAPPLFTAAELAALFLRRALAERPPLPIGDAA
jgi:AcrR family transcriptional regulator